MRKNRVSGLAIIPHGGCSADFITREDLTASSSSRAMILVFRSRSQDNSFGIVTKQS
jgi:hypothetical protein